MNPMSNTGVFNKSAIGSFTQPVTPMNSKTGMSWGGKEYRGPKMDIKNGDPMKNKPVRVLGEPRAKVFNMEDEKDVAEYQKVMLDCVHSKAHIAIKTQLPDQKPFRIYLEWYSDYYTHPEGAANAK